MAGHNKWSKVKHIKANVDAKRAKLFSHFSKEITIAARLGGGDPDMNPRLRTAVNSARKQSMPSDNIERAIKKGTGNLSGNSIEEILYEGYGPQGSAFLVMTATDNKNRSAADIRCAFSKNGGSLGTPNSVAYNFTHLGKIHFTKIDSVEESKLIEAAIEAGAEEFHSEKEGFSLQTSPTTLYQVAQNLEEAGFSPDSCQLAYHPQTIISIEDPHLCAEITQLWEALENLDDVQNVFTNVAFSESALAPLA